MYLKSLVLKGFKSFADRSALTLEPGITAVVGPNGSGKSNISDAVLWVLGERNAKNLRGQAMEDVIFAGSSARKASGLAEVDLVLDNSDGTLPVDFDEVAITRRMYRNGESEYLINGTVARRMDVLDILHDSGLGTGTHSIISQGSLDSILQSKPEDRRALIEEAAGVLKHKQRKAKSERKLANMDQHLLRARDVVGEVARQLGPLERKAKKARTYQELAAQQAEMSLTIAVDDLRGLQKEWDAAKAREAALAAELEERRGAIQEAEAAVEALQERIRQQTLDAGDLSRRHRAAATAVERFDSAAMMLRERRRAAPARAGANTPLPPARRAPGLFSLVRALAAAVLPCGESYTFWGRGVSQGHSDAVRRIPGVRDARQYTIPVPAALDAVRSGANPALTTRQKHMRECFVVAEEGADRARIEQAIITMPHYFADYDTTVHFLSEEELLRDHGGLPHGGFVFRGGRTGRQEQNRALVEFRLTLDSNPEFTACVLTAFARAAFRLGRAGQAGCKTVFDIPPAALSPLSPEELRRQLL